MRKEFISAVGLGAAAGLLAGCSQTAPHESCKVFDQNAEQVTPLSYAAGEVAVAYTLPEQSGVGYGLYETSGYIQRLHNTFRLVVPQLRHDLATESRGFDDPAEAPSAAVLAFTSLEMGTLSVTSGCVSYGDVNNVPSATVELPSAS